MATLRIFFYKNIAFPQRRIQLYIKRSLNRLLRYLVRMYRFPGMDRWKSALGVMRRSFTIYWRQFRVNKLGFLLGQDIKVSKSGLSFSPDSPYSIFNTNTT